MVYEFSKRIYKEQFGKILTILSIICGLVIFCTSTAFADDDMSLLTEQGQSYTDSVSVNDTEPFSVQDTDAMLHQAADKIAYEVSEAGLLSDSGTKATDYAYSIYQYLQSTIHPDLTGIKNTLQNGIYVDTSNISSKLDIIYNVLYGSTTSVPTSQTIWYNLSNIYTSILSGRNLNNSLTTLGYLPLIDSKLSTADGGTVAGYSASIAQSSGSSASTLNTINTKLTTGFQNIINLTNIDWTETGTYNGLKTDLSQSSYMPVGGPYAATEVFYYFNLGSYQVPNHVFKFECPLQITNHTDLYSKPEELVQIGFISSSGNFINLDMPINFVLQNRYLYVYTNLNYRYVPTNNVVVKITFSSNISFSTTENYNGHLYSIPEGVEDFYIVSNYITNGNFNNNLSKLTSMYASDDELTAREQSKPQIDEALDGFTGSGSGAASVSDISGAKGVSSSLKSGLATGESSSTALTVFNPANAFYGWFSQDNANYFTEYTPSRSINNWDNIEWTDDEVKLVPIIEQNIYSLVGNER